jgi:lambda family phage portal protein
MTTQTTRRILGADGRPLVPTLARAARATRSLSATYDAARTTNENSRHWALADGLSANAAASPEVRRTLRNRARYEVANNSYARGMVLTIANDCIGTGPRLQLTGEGISEEDATFVEREFAAWMQATNLPEKLRVMRVARSEDGEAFGIETDNPALPTPVKLDVQVVEADQCTSLSYLLPTPQHIDGIRYDAAGNPVVYEIARVHPGDPLGGFTAMTKPEQVPAARVFHWFRIDRPGQRRGVPEITPALPLFAQLRRLTLAVIAAAETAADIAAYIETEAPTAGEADELEPLDTIPIEPRTLMTLPAGSKVSQLKAEQPSTGYKEFKNEIINEIARCQNLPFNVAAGNSSGYNYSSGRLDHQIYFRSLEVDRAQLVTVMLDRIFANWLREAILIAGYFPASLRAVTDWSHQWFWDGGDLIDPEGESKALINLLEVGGTTLADHYARKGQDWQKKMLQRSRELDMERKRGMRAPLAPLAGEGQDPAAGKEAEAAAPAANIQDASLNGAQVTSLAAIISAVATGQLPIETARGLIVASFTTINEEEANRILRPLEGFKPTPAPTPAPKGRPAADDGEDAPNDAKALSAAAAGVVAIGETARAVLQGVASVAAEAGAKAAAAATPAIHVHAADQPPPVVHVTAQSAAPIVSVKVEPTPVKIENNVQVDVPPQVPVIAKELPDGTVLMTPQQPETQPE